MLDLEQLKAFYAALEANPVDELTHYALADWYDEHDLVPESEVLRWLARERKTPYCYRADNEELTESHNDWHDGWYWWTTDREESWGTPESCVLPHKLWCRLRHGFDYNPVMFREYASLRLAIEALIAGWKRKRAWYRRRKARVTE